LSDENRYSSHVDEVINQIPDADRTEVEQAFARYEKEFLIPPEDALRSVIRRFQSDKDPPANTSSGSSSSPAPTRKVSRLSELSAEDRNIEIEVRIISHNSRVQQVRGEDRDIAFGLLEDQPWDNSTASDRWEYKDWGGKTNLAPGSIVRIEGASVNEYQGKMSLNINQSSRIVVLQESSQPIVDVTEPISVAQALDSDGTITVVGRVLSRRDDQIHRKDGSGSIDIVRGRIADDSGTIGFISWESFEFDEGSLIKIERAQIRRFRDTPEINIGRYTKVEVFHDAGFADLEDLKAGSRARISDLRDGSRDIDLVVQLESWTKRSFTNDQGEEKNVWSGELIDPSGRCRMSAWEEVEIDEGNLPQTIQLRGVRVRTWQGIPDITVDSASQITFLESPPWGEVIDGEDHIVEVDLPELASGSSRVGIKTSGSVVSIRPDSGLITRCPDCRRVLRDGECTTHGSVEGVEDVRLRMVIDDGIGNLSLLLNKDTSLNLLGIDDDTFRNRFTTEGSKTFIEGLRNSFLGVVLNVKGRTIVDEQGGMLIADSAEIVDLDPALAAAEVRTQWGVE